MTNPIESTRTLLPDPTTATSPFAILNTDDLNAAAQASLPWLWHGFLAPGNITLLTSQWKSGKTTLIAVLLSRLKAGGQLAGLPVLPGRATVVSEEGPLHWYRRSQKLLFGNHLSWLCRPFRGRPRPDDWLALLDYLVELRVRDGLDLLVIDPLASFLPGRNENGAGGMLDTLLPLQRLTAQGVAVLVAHHPRKGETIAGQAARGSGALSGYVDILIEMNWFGRPGDDDRRRRLQTYSRYEETPHRLVIELTEDGTDYVSHGDFEEVEFTQSWQPLRLELEGAANRLTLQEIRKQWSGFEPPDEVTLWRWLKRAVALGLVLRDGAGRRNDPFRYWLPGMEEKWREDPFSLEALGELGDLQAIAGVWPKVPRGKKERSQ